MYFPTPSELSAIHPERAATSGEPWVRYLVAESVKRDKDTWEFRSEFEAQGVPVPKGFWMDAASIPQFLWWRTGPHQLSFSATGIHDWPYYLKTNEEEARLKYGDDIVDATLREIGTRRTRLVVDRKFLAQMEDAGVPEWRREEAYRWVRRLGWYHYNTN